MEDNILKINSMLLSQDKEMRALGFAMMQRLPAKTDKWGKILLYFNSGWETIGRTLFYREKKTLRNYDRLLELFERCGYSYNTLNTLKRIEYCYKNTKKLTELLKEDTRLAEFMKNTEPVSFKSDWFDDFDH